MPRIEFPVTLETTFCGKAGSSGSFRDEETGEQVSFADAFAFDFDSVEGNVQRLVLRANKIDEVADFDVSKLVRYQDRVRFEGNVVMNNEKGGYSYFKPYAIKKVTANPKA